MPRVTFNRLTKKRSTTRKRRTSTIVRAKYKPKTTTANRSLIQSNAYAIRAVKRMMPPPIYSDYQGTGGYGPFITGAPAPFFNILSQELMHPNLWAEVLRQDPTVIASSSTLVKRMQINLRYTLGAANWCQITTFIVSLRKDAADKVVNEAGLTAGQDYITMNPGNAQQFNPRLNPSVFRTHYVRNVSLMSGAWGQPTAALPGGEPIVANSATTYAKGSVNMNLNFRLRQPTGTRWRIMTQEQLSPHQKLYLLTFFRGQTDEPDDDPTRVDWDALYTCYNAS